MVLSDITADTKLRAQYQSNCRPTATGTTPFASRRPSTRSPPMPKSIAVRRAGHVVNIREVRLAAGAEFIVVVCGDVMTMPGLPKVPSADKIDIDENGKVVGLF
jgi:formate--tetrahydrofolate ligase